MIGEHFYHKSIKKAIATFASVFSEITILSGTGKTVKVPIHFAQKQKFIEALYNNPDVRNTYSDITLPVLGFEVVSFLYNSERMTNPTNVQHQRLSQDKNSIDFMFTSVPYTIGFEMFLMTNTLDEAYQIIEQIIPFFTPNLTITIKDKDMFNLETNLTFDLTSISQDIQYESSFDEKRIINYQLSFSCHTKFHSNPRSIEKIKKVMISMYENDYDKKFDELIGIRQKNGEFEWN